MAGITNEGFVLKTLEEIKADIEAELRSRFGETIDLRPQSTFGQLVGIFSEQQAEVWALAADVYLSQYPDSASGIQLDRVASITATVRKPATPSQATLICYGTEGTLLSAGQEIETADGVTVLETLDDVTISAAAARDVYLNVVTVGAGAYTVSINGVSYTYTAGGGDTTNSILNGLVTAIGTTVVTPSNVNSQLRLLNTATNFSTVAVTANLAIAKRGSAVEAAAQDFGGIQLPVGTVTSIQTPVAGWDSVTNLVDGIVGQDRETDEALRLRRTQSVDHSILAAILAKEGVVQAVVRENNGTVTDGDGTPPQHIWAIVQGGSNGDIADAIIDKNAAGIGMRGAVAVSVTSPITGSPHVVRFDRPTIVNPTLALTYTLAEDGAAFPSNGEALVKQALVDYTAGFRIGQDLVYSRLFGVIHAVGGIQVNTLTVNGASATLPAANNAIIQLLSGNITLTAV
ncbi:XkdT Uncharacterized homolog of phage Mu protein gp47 [uncultured Caudovirales phage]|uniref:XkdT Uncharacterized homolog of phage Mu protein gp47 n=1 Tax=uncultured Caudovirales phage TaxID=2100421 RepID=A0A6J7WYN2_9CAUD|nr:XkdT Uncharacterized homolog of phage Mu protein gp47 [uncultured Caudovirales phage]